MSERLPASSSAHSPGLSPTPEELEQLRPLVRRLVWDASEVDDVLQEVWLAGQRGLAGIAAGARRSWLVTTARRIAGHRRRREGERADREAWARFGGGSPEDAVQTRESVDQEVERLDAMGRLIEALGQLPDLERTAVSLRYLEGLPPRKIAGRIGKNPDQTRQILHRGIKRLRASLDREYEDERRAWIAPLLGVGWPWSWRVGMVACAVALPMAAAFLAVLIQGEPQGERELRGDASANLAAPVAGEPEASSERAAETAGPTAPARRSETGSAPRSEVSVVDGLTGESIERVELHWAALPSGQPWRAWSDERSGDVAPWIESEARASAQSIQLLARAAGYASGWWVLSPERAGQPCRLELWPLDRTLGGRVQNNPGKPLSDVRVSVLPKLREPLGSVDPGERDLDRDVPLLSAFAWEREPVARTDANGRWSLPAPRQWSQWELRFEHTRYMADGVIAGRPKESALLEVGEHVATLNSGRPLRGRVVNSEGEGVPDVELLTLPRLAGKSRRAVTRARSDAQGWFEMGVPDGFEGWLRAEGARGRSALVRYDAGSGVQRLELPDQRAAQLRLEDSEGLPLGGWRVSWSDPGRDPAECWTRTDADGRAELEGVPAGVELLHAQRGREAANWDALPVDRSEPWTWRLSASVALELQLQGPSGSEWLGPVEVEYLRRQGETLLRRRLEPERLGPGHLRVTLNADERAELQAWIGVSAAGCLDAFRALSELDARTTWSLRAQVPGEHQSWPPRGDGLRFTFEAYPAGASVELDGVPPRIPAGVARWSWSDAPPADLGEDMLVLGWGRNSRGALVDVVCAGTLGEFRGVAPPADVRLGALRSPLAEEPAGVRYELRGAQRVELGGVVLTRQFDHVHRPASAGRTLRLNHLLPGELDLWVERYELLDSLPMDEATGRDLARSGAPFIAPDGESIRLRIAAGGKLVAERRTARAERRVTIESGRVTEIELPR